MSPQRHAKSGFNHRIYLSRLGLAAALTLATWVMIRDVRPIHTRVPTAACRAQARQTLTGHPSRIYATAVSPQGDWMASGDLTGLIRIWHAQTLQVRSEIAAHADAISELVISPGWEAVIEF